jgi:hypothetical protein
MKLLKKKTSFSKDYKPFLKVFIVFLLSSFLVTSCSNNEDDEFLNSNKNENKEEEQVLNYSEETTNDLIQSIPSPVEMSALLKSSGGKFNSQYLSKSKDLERFKNKYEKAINMGVFVADLGYINIYENTMYAMNYLNAIKVIADELKVGQFFDFETLKRLSSNSKNADSLLHISTSNFNKMDAYLREQKRSELSVLMITGAWLEGLHLACQVATSLKSVELNERVGEQKINIEVIMEIMESFKKMEYFSTLHKQLSELKDVFDKVEIKFEYAEPVRKEIDGKLVVVDNSETIINITDKQIQQIKALTEKIRKEIVKS